MANNISVSIKHLQINKANSNIILAVSLAAAISVFSLVSSKALFTQAAYQSRVLKERNKALNTLKENIKAKDSLVNEYKIFASGDPNIIGGSATGEGENDGDNARIVLDSLPSKYDFPALATSVSKVLQKGGVAGGSFLGTDLDPTIAAAAASATPVAASGSSSSSATSASTSSTTKSPATATTTVVASTPLQMDFSTSYTGNYATVQQMIKNFERSIRPFVVQKIQIGGKDSDMQVTTSYSTYMQPSKTLTIPYKDVK